MRADARPEYPLTDPVALAEPYGLYHDLRRADPVHWSEGLGAWVLTRYDDVLAALRDSRLVRARPEALAGGSVPAGAADFELRVGRLLDDPQFTAEVLERSRPVIWRVVDGLLDRAAAGFQIDAVADLARPLTAAVLAELLAIPAEDRGPFREWSEAAALTPAGPGANAAPAEGRAPPPALLDEYVRGLVRERRRNPGDDLLSVLLAGEGADCAEEGCPRLVMMLAAGLGATVDQFGNAVFALLTHPDQLDRLTFDPALVPSAVEESLRFDGPIPFVPRLAAVDLQLGGREVRRGQCVFLGLAAANRDPEVFAAPDRFDVRRRHNPHLAFGAGLFQCLGAGLARRELEAALLAVVRRLPRLRLDPDRRPSRRPPSLAHRGFLSLPVRFS